MINNTINELQSLLISVPVRIASIPANMVNSKPAENKWSKQEILGHLCDSAINNISRIVKAPSAEQPFVIQKYEQDEWVKNNNYREQHINDVIDLWKALNRQFITAALNIPNEKLSMKCDLGNGETITLQYLIEDYLAHMKHHLGQILKG
jgi:hypothetical protein